MHRGYKLLSSSPSRACPIVPVACNQRSTSDPLTSPCAQWEDAIYCGDVLRMCNRLKSTVVRGDWQHDGCLGRYSSVEWMVKVRTGGWNITARVLQCKVELDVQGVSREMCSLASSVSVLLEICRCPCRPCTRESSVRL